MEESDRLNPARNSHASVVSSNAAVASKFTPGKSYSPYYASISTTNKEKSVLKFQVDDEMKTLNDMIQRPPSINLPPAIVSPLSSKELFSFKKGSEEYQLLTKDALFSPTRRSNRSKTVLEGGKPVFDSDVLQHRINSLNGNPDITTVNGGHLSNFIKLVGFDRPIQVKKKAGTGLVVPSAGFNVKNVVELLGYSYPINVIEVATQAEFDDWTLGEWCKYYNTPMEQRDRVLNVISLEFSGTDLEDKVKAPSIVRDIDWISMFPTYKKLLGNYPRIQNYCLMSVQGSFTDFHIDLGGTSVWYHVHTGQKVFILAAPTKANLKEYEKWIVQSKYSRCFLGGMLDNVFVIEVKRGETLLIPCGWIHAVYTPVDSLVFGGNFLHSLDIMGQLNIYDIECRTNVPRKYLLPYFEPWHWFVAHKLLLQFRTPSYQDNIPPSILEHIKHCIPMFIGKLSTWHSNALMDVYSDAGTMTLNSAREASSLCECVGPMDMLSELGVRVRGDHWILPPSKSSQYRDVINIKTKLKEGIDGIQPLQVRVKVKLKEKQDNNDDSNNYSNNNKNVSVILMDGDWLVKCVCGATGVNYDDGKRMVECGVCFNWMHTDCYNIGVDDEPSSDFTCFDCRKKEFSKIDASEVNIASNMEVTNDIPEVLEASAAEEDTWLVKCVCGVDAPNYDDGKPMIQCSDCNVWLHTECLGLNEANVPQQFKCPDCKAKVKMKIEEKLKMETKARDAEQRAKVLKTHQARSKRRQSRGVEDPDTVTSSSWTFDCSCGIKQLNYTDKEPFNTCVQCGCRYHSRCADPIDPLRCQGCLIIMDRKKEKASKSTGVKLKLPRLAVQREVIGGGSDGADSDYSDTFNAGDDGGDDAGDDGDFFMGEEDYEAVDLKKPGTKRNAITGSKTGGSASKRQKKAKKLTAREALEQRLKRMKRGR